MKVVSLFTGAGGLDLGLERAGFEIAGCVEADRDCRATVESNRQNWPLVSPGDIHAHRPSDIVRSLGLTRGAAALLAGGPPCQPFSKSGQWKNGNTKRMRDPRAITLRAYLRVLEASLPSVMLLENVQGIAATRKRVTDKYEGLDVLRSSLRAINRRHGTRYEPHALVIDAADHGVPQHRVRVFVVASRDGGELEVPAPTRVSSTLSAQRGPRLPLATAWDALGDLDDPDFDPRLLPTGTWAPLLASIPEGGNYLHHTPRGEGEPLFGWRRRYWSFLLKLAKARPSWTIQAQAGSATGPFHWRSRRLTTREIARLQCFPDEWLISGKSTSARRQLGNAVPPPIGEVLGLEIRRQFFREKPRRKPPLTPPPRPDCPPPEPVGEVPSDFLSLRGRHPDHPGAGHGPGAVRRRNAGEHEDR